MNRRFVAAMVAREARSARGRLLLYGCCMALGIAALVGLHGLRSTVENALDDESRRLLGADLRLSSRQPLGGDVAERVAALMARDGVRAVEVTRFGSMGLAERSGQTRLVDVQAIESAFPIHGVLRSEPESARQGLHGDGALEAIVDPSLLVQLDMELGDVLALGDARFRVSGTIAKAPGSFALQSQIAPRVFIDRGHVARTRLLEPGSLVEHLLYLGGPQPLLAAWLEVERERLDREHVRVQTVASYQEELTRSFGVLTGYLGLVGLAALALGGVGVAAGIRSFVREKLDTVALLRSLGAQSGDVLAVYAILSLALGAVSGAIGAALGVALQWTLPVLMRGLLPVDVEPRFEPAAVATGIMLGLWVTLLFSAGPLFDLGRVPPLRALRRDFAPEGLPARGRVALVVALVASLVLASLWQAPNSRVGLSFAVGLGGALLLLAAAAAGAAGVLRRHPPRRAPYWLRQGVANLFRPRNHTVSTVLTIGFGLFLVSTLHGVQHNVLAQIAVDTRPDRPNLILFDVQSDQLADLEAFLAERDAPILDRASLISARISGFAGRPVADWLDSGTTDRELRWALQREYRLTYHSVPRESESIVEGRWWRADTVATSEPVPISLETSLAATLGAGLGDAIQWNIQGVPVDTTVESLRRVDWGRFATNFFVVFPPGLIEQAPQTSVLLARVADARERAELQRDLVGRFPNVSALDATVMLRAFDAMLGKFKVAVRVLAFFTLATGLMILVAASATARAERTREVLLLRTLGASSSTLRRIVSTEAVSLAGLASLVGALLALIASWALVRFVFELPFDPPLLRLAGLAAFTLVIGSLLGGATGRPLRVRSPLAALRAEDAA